MTGTATVKRVLLLSLTQDTEKCNSARNEVWQGWKHENFIQTSFQIQTGFSRF